MVTLKFSFAPLANDMRGIRLIVMIFKFVMLEGIMTVHCVRKKHNVKA